MNEKRFIELLNLYIDGEISPAEQEELDHEIADNPRRRKTYQSYRLLQEASQHAYRQFGEELAETVDLKKYQILARSSSRCCLRRGLLYSTGALAAACLTVVASFAVFHDSHRDSAIRAAQKEGFGLVEVLDQGALNPKSEERGFGASIQNSFESFTFAGRSGLDRSNRKTAFLDSSRAEFQVSSQESAWENNFRGETSGRVFRGRSAIELSSELATFEFQR